LEVVYVKTMNLVKNVYKGANEQHEPLDYAHKRKWCMPELGRQRV